MSYPYEFTLAYLLSDGAKELEKGAASVKIGLLTQWFPPEGGPASVPGVLARELVQRGHQVTVLTGLPNYPTGILHDGYRRILRTKETYFGAQVFRTWLFASHDASVAKRLLNYGSFALTASVLGSPQLPKLDVLWVYNSPISVALPMEIISRKQRIPVVMHLMDIWPESIVASGFATRNSGWWRRPVLRWCDYMNARADVICTISPGAHSLLVSRGVPESKIHYAPLWTNESAYFPMHDNLPLRKALGIQPEEFVLMYAGALGKAQDVKFFAEAFSSIPESLPIRMIVVGTGTQAEDISVLAEQSGGRLLHFDYVPEEEMESFMSISDMHLVGFADREMASFSMPSKVQSIMASGKPILTVGSGDLSELVSARGIGHVVQQRSFEAIQASIREIALMGRVEAARRGSLARETYVELFSVTVGVGRIERILLEVGADSEP